MKTKQDYYLLNIKNWNTLSDVDKSMRHCRAVNDAVGIMPGVPVDAGGWKLVAGITAAAVPRRLARIVGAVDGAPVAELANSQTNE